VEDGNLKMYKLENEIDGIVIDPLKALHCIEVNFKFFSSGNSFVLETKNYFCGILF